MKNTAIAKLGVFFIAGMANHVLADISINATRIIYPADKKEITFTINNSGKKASLIQTWLDEGNTKDTPDNTTAPFLLTPPISVLPPDKGQNIRVRFTGETTLPTDKETLFWVNVLEVPQNTDDANQLRIGIRSRVKFFYRPEKLASTSENAPSQLSWKLQHKNGQWTVLSHNSSPYHITFSNISINTPEIKGSADLPAQKTMLFPGGNAEYAIKPNKEDSKPGINFSIINDYGGNSSFTGKITE